METTRREGGTIEVMRPHPAGDQGEEEECGLGGRRRMWVRGKKKNVG